jgi:hypothetical protein
LLIRLALPLLPLVTLLASGCPRDVVDAVGRSRDGGLGTGGGTGGSAGNLPDGAVPDPCDAATTDPACGPVTWPNEISFTNSDLWLRQHHDSLTSMRPRVLVLDFYNPRTLADITRFATDLAAGLAESSRYHAYSDPVAPPFMMYQITKVVDLLDHPAPAGTNGSSRVPRDASGNFDATQLFNQAYADLYAIPNPDQPGRNLTLCELFERGMFNEVWMAVGEDAPRGPLIMERKQIYDANGAPRAGQFEACAGNEQGTCLTGATCTVTVRLAHLSPVRPIGCDIEIRGLPFESRGTLQAVPYLGLNAASFFNKDFRKFPPVSFDSWYDICDAAGVQQCIAYPTPTTATGMTTDGPWTIDPFIQGCGSVRFPPNAHARNDFLSTTAVQARCEHFGMKDGVGGEDAPDLFTPDKIATYTTVFGSGLFPCGGNWQVYLRQSMPGFRNRAFDANGNPMKNWWPFLFY